MEPREISIELPVSGLTLRGLQWEGKGTPILALHGWLDNAASFVTLAPLLGGRPLVAIDFPGHGLSDPIPPGGLYHFVDSVFVILEIERVLGWTTYALMGHSMGGAAASLYATSAPTAVRALMLIDGLGPLAAPVSETHARFIKHLHLRASLPEKDPPRYRTVTDAIRARAIATGIKGDVIRPVVERGLKPLEGGYAWRTDPRLTIPSPMRFMEEQIQELFSHLTMPTLHIVAESGILTDEGPFPARHREAWIKNLATARLAGGHHVHLESPDKVAEVMRKFLAANAL